MKTILSLIVLLAAFCSQATQPPVGGVFEGAWEKNLTNEVVDYCVWESTNGMVRWRQIIETTNEGFLWTNNNITPLTFYAVTQIPRNPPGSTDTRRMSEMRFLHWAPSGTNIVINANSYVRLAAVDVPVNQPVKLSGDLKVFQDWLTFGVRVGPVELTNAVVMVKYKSSPLRPQFFAAFPEAEEEAVLVTASAAPVATSTNRLNKAAIAKPPPLP
jgi:hypothetical protein